MSEPEEAEQSKNGWPEHKVGPWPEHVKVLIKGMWLNCIPPAQIAERINALGVLSKPIHANTISQFFTTEKKKDPSIVEKRIEMKTALVEASEQAVAEMHQSYLGKIKESTILVFSEVTDRQPKVIRDILDLLDGEDDPKIIRELSVALKIHVDVLSKLSGADIAARVQEYRGKKLIDVEFHGQEEDGPRNVTPSVVDVDGWIGPKH